MKLSYIINLTVLVLCSYQKAFSALKDSAKIISVEGDIVARDESVHFKYPNAKAVEYFIVITLTNTQDTTIRIRIMTCSWSESFTFDNDSLGLSYPGCDSNFPTTVEIASHKTVKCFAKLSCSRKNQNYKNSLSFKIGFVDLPYDNFFDLPCSEKNKAKYKTYWSDSITLKSKLYFYEEEKLSRNW